MVYTGLHIDDETVRLVELEQEHDSVVVRAMGGIEFPRGIVESYRIIEPDVLVEYIQQSVQESLPRPIVLDNFFSTVPQSKVRSHAFTFPSELDEEAIRSAIAIQFSEYFPFEPEQAIIDWRKVQQSEATQTIFVAACRTRYRDQLLDLADRLGATLTKLDIESASAARAIMPYDIGEAASLLVHFGETVTSITVFDSRGMQYASSLYVGVENIVNQIAVMQASDHTAAHELMHQVNMNDSTIPTHQSAVTALRSQIRPVIAEIERLIRLYKGSHFQKVEGVYLSGHLSVVHGIAAYMEEELSVPVQLGNSLLHVVGGEEIVKQKGYMAPSRFDHAIGVALGGMPHISYYPTFNLLDPKGL